MTTLARDPAQSVTSDTPAVDHFRFHRAHAHLASPFGPGWFGRKAEAFARLFGTPIFLGVQTALVIAWICLNALGTTVFDPYPFILLNLAFSIQAAYAAPLILLAQTRQAERDKAHADADALHREALAVAADQRQVIAAQSAAQMLALLEQNTHLTELTRQMAERIESLTAEVHRKILQPDTPSTGHSPNRSEP